MPPQPDHFTYFVPPREITISTVIYDDVARPNRPLRHDLVYELNSNKPTGAGKLHRALGIYIGQLPGYDLTARKYNELYLTTHTVAECELGLDMSDKYDYQPLQLAKSVVENVTLEMLLTPILLKNSPFCFVWLHSNAKPSPKRSVALAPDGTSKLPSTSRSGAGVMPPPAPVTTPSGPITAPPRQFTELPSTAPQIKFQGTKRRPSPDALPLRQAEPAAQKRRTIGSFSTISLLDHQPTVKIRGTNFGMRIFIVAPKREGNISAAALAGEAVRDISQLPKQAILVDKSMFAQVVYEIAKEVSGKIFLMHHYDYNLLFFLCSLLEVVHSRHWASHAGLYLHDMLINGHSAASQKYDTWRVNLSTLVSAVSSPRSFEDALRTCLVSSFLCFIQQSYNSLWKEVDKMANAGQTFDDILKETLSRISELRRPDGPQVMILVVGYNMASDAAWFMSIAGRRDSIHPSILASALAISFFEPLRAWVNSNLVAAVYCFGTHGGLVDEMHPHSTILQTAAVDISNHERVRPFTSIDVAELECVLLSTYPDIRNRPAAETETSIRARINEVVAYAGGYNSDTGSAEGIRWSWFFEIVAKISTKQQGFKSHDTLSKKPGELFSRTFCNPEYLPQSLATIGTLMAQMPKKQIATLLLLAADMSYSVPRGDLLDDHLRYNDVRPVPTGSSPSEKVDMYPASLFTLLRLLIAMGLLVVMPQSVTLSTTAPRQMAATSHDIDTVMADANAEASPVDAAIFDSDATKVIVKAPNSRACAFLHQICTQHQRMLKVDSAIEGPHKFGQWAADGIEAHLKDQVTRTIEKISENTFQQLLMLLVKVTGNSSAFSVVEELELTDPSSKWKDPNLKKKTDLIYADIFIPEYTYLVELKVATLEAIKSGVMGWKEKDYADYDTLKKLDEALQTMDMTPTPSRAEAHIWSDEKADNKEDFKAPDKFKTLTWKDLRIRIYNQKEKYMTLDELWHNAHQQVKDYWDIVTIGNIPEKAIPDQKLVSDRRVASIKLAGTETRSGYRGVMLLVGGRRVLHDVEKVDGMNIMYCNSVVTGSHTP
ncbi:hypothetical protein BDZ89DRAFT_1111967 [Hymenopellis radicata]|nr:hypothetical protein BDZ89DRAFT_1111967 [Hymenopellis radicata]